MKIVKLNFRKQAEEEVKGVRGSTINFDTSVLTTQLKSTLHLQLLPVEMQRNGPNKNKKTSTKVTFILVGFSNSH